MAALSKRRGPVLLLGGGAGEATCGILYLASHLRRHGVEAFVRLTDTDETYEALRESVGRLVGHLKPALVGISFKWFHHVARTLEVAQAVREAAPGVHVTVGGNSASYFFAELLGVDAIDSVVLGDGEVPLLALAQGHPAPPNVVRRVNGRAPSKPRLGYVQGATSDEVYYSHFDQLFLSQLDAASFSGWVAPGKGCGENCLYCGGTRGMQQATFGRAKPFLRPIAAVQADHAEVVPRTWQLRYDFSGSTPELLEAAWAHVDLSRHATTYFLWGIPPPGLAATLARHFGRVFMVIDVGCFSQTQRQAMLGRGLLKPCPTDAQLEAVIDDVRQHENLELEISGIAGLPFATPDTLREERALVGRLLERGCTIGYQRLEAQPGALVTEHPEHFGMRTEARRFDEFLAYFRDVDPSAKTVPMVRYADARFEAQVQACADEVDELVWRTAAAKRRLRVTPKTRLVARIADDRAATVGAWLGPHEVSGRVAAAPVRLLRAPDGAGLALAPSLKGQQGSGGVVAGPEAALLGAALDAFASPSPVELVARQLAKQHRLQPEEARGLIDHLVEGGFLGRP